MTKPSSAQSYTLFQDYPDMMNMSQVQDALNIGRSTTYKLIHSGDIGHISIGKSFRVPKNEVISYVQKHMESCYNIVCSSQGNLHCQKGNGEKT